MKNTTVCYIEQDGAYLMLHRVKKKHDENAGQWIGVGGHCEENESPEDCVQREVREETGLTLTRWRCRGLVTFVTDAGEGQYMHLFTADGFTGTLTEDCDEGDLAWIPKTELSNIPRWEGDDIFLRLLAEDAPWFSLKVIYEGGVLKKAVLNGETLDWKNS